MMSKVPSEILLSHGSFGICAYIISTETFRTHYLKSECRTVLNARGALTPDTDIFLLYFSYCTQGLRSLR